MQLPVRSVSKEERGQAPQAPAWITNSHSPTSHSPSAAPVQKSLSFAPIQKSLGAAPVQKLPSASPQRSPSAVPVIRTIRGAEWKPALPTRTRSAFGAAMKKDASFNNKKVVPVADGATDACLDGETANNKNPTDDASPMVEEEEEDEEEEDDEDYYSESDASICESLMFKWNQIQQNLLRKAQLIPSQSKVVQLCLGWLHLSLLERVICEPATVFP